MARAPGETAWEAAVIEGTSVAACVTMLPRIAFALVLAVPLPATAADAPALVADDLALDVLTTEESSERALSDDELATTFNRMRCACAVPVRLRVSLTKEGVDKVKDDLDVELRVGDDCADGDDAARCPLLATGTIAAGAREHVETIGVDRLFRQVTTEAKPCETNGTKSVTVWAWLRSDGKKLEQTPSRGLKLRGTAPPSPKIKAIVAGEDALAVSWSPPADESKIAAYQIVCDPPPARADTAAFSTCTGDGAAAIGEDRICSERLDASARTARVTGLSNGTSYAVSVVAIDAFGNPSEPSPIVRATPAPSVDFFEAYQQAGGDGQPGCAMAPAPGAPPAWGWLLLFGLALMVSRRAR